MANAESGTAQWRIFSQQPAVFAHPRRIVHCFDGLIGEDVAARLGREERFRERLSGLIASSYGLSQDVGEAESPGAAIVTVIAAGRLDALMRRAGAVYWARAIVGRIRASAVIAIKEAVGEEAYAAAIAHRDLASADPELPDIEVLNAAIVTAGLNCLAAWCAQQPPGLAERVRLALGDDTDDAVAAPFAQAGPPIVDRLIA